MEQQPESKSTLSPTPILMNEIREWFASDLGRRLLAAEHEAMERIIRSIFGYHLLQVGFLPDQPLYEHAPASHKFQMVPAMGLGLGENSVVGAAAELPFASDCIDAVILHHALDFTESPHQVLREAARVLRPGGRLIDVSFNPASLWGVYRALSRKKDQVPWCGQFIRQRRLHDWLTLLEFKQERIESGFYRPPFYRQRTMQRMEWLERWGSRSFNKHGGFHITLATKETLAMTPIAMNWRRRLVFPLVRKPLQQAGRDQMSPVSEVIQKD
ncbi:MAG: methyltransferase domain-containing protein [Motiliproteus sp.]|nr:methyltransferase domain-containing protein [Motiliproteus sp.]MCW9052671.1 methyltransferase domain-containing protein [Motiliproteus sp.]